jgi:hypothetical protein
VPSKVQRFKCYDTQAPYHPLGPWEGRKLIRPLGLAVKIKDKDPKDPGLDLTDGDRLFQGPTRTRKRTLHGLSPGAKLLKVGNNTG